MFKNKINNYFALEFVKDYLFILSIFSLLLWSTQSARLLYLITETGLSISAYAQYVALLLPRSITQLMHLSLLISIFLLITKFQNNKELEIYWLSGISKYEIINIILKISIIITLICLFLYSFLTPLTNGKSRLLLVSSEFSVINSLVKQNNFNSPLKGVTIYVHKNDNQGNLEKIYIFENNKNIISKYGRVLDDKGKKILELTDGVIHEKNNNNEITFIKFKKTLYDFTKYQRNLITTQKVQEINLIEVYREYQKTKNLNFLYEIHKRLIKPLFIPLIAILCCFIIYSNDQKINIKKIKIFIFILVTFLIIFIEILLNLSVLNTYFKYILYLFPITGFFFSYLALKKFLSNETGSI